MATGKRYDGSEADVKGAAVYANFPGLLNPTSDVFARLFSIARTYATLQKYDITNRTFLSITQLVVEYLKLRADNLQMPTSSHAVVFGSGAPPYDAVLTKQMEEFSALYQFALSRKDEEICRQIIECHRRIALVTIDINPFFTHPGENATTSFVIGFVDSLTSEACTHGLDDACLAGCRALSDIGSSVVRRDFYVNFRSAIDALGKIASLGIVRPSQVLTGEAVSAMTRMVASSLPNSFMVRNTFSHSIELLEEISKAQLQALGPARGIDFSVQHTLGAFLSIPSRTGLATWFQITGNRILEAFEQHDSEAAEDAMHVFNTISDKLWLHLANIGEAAAQTESFALFFVDINVREIGKIQIILNKQVQRNLPQPQSENTAQSRWRYDRFSLELLRALDWLIGAIHWRIYKALPKPVRSNLVWNFFDTLQELGIMSLEAGLQDQATTAIKHLSSLVSAILEKPMEDPYAPGRVAAHIAKVGMVALQLEDEAVVANSIDTLAELNSKIYAKFVEVEELQTSLLRAIDEIDEELYDDVRSLDEIKVHFARSVSPDTVKKYIARLHDKLQIRRQA